MVLRKIPVETTNTWVQPHTSNLKSVAERPCSEDVVVPKYCYYGPAAGGSTIPCLKPGCIDTFSWSSNKAASFSCCIRSQQVQQQALRQSVTQSPSRLPRSLISLRCLSWQMNCRPQCIAPQYPKHWWFTHDQPGRRFSGHPPL